jgi:hypothetical protein
MIPDNDGPKSLKDCLKKVGEDKEFANLGVAVVDLTRAGPLSAPLAGWNQDRQMTVGSLAKIAAMFAAFYLRKSVNDAVRGIVFNDLDVLFQRITQEWKPLVESKIDGVKTKDFPKLDVIFKRQSGSQGKGDWQVNFNGSFLEDMRDIFRFQDIAERSNGAAAKIIRPLGFQYINGAVAADKLYSSASGGLWLTKDYTGLDGGKDPKGHTNRGATAEAVGQFLARVQMGRLVGQKSCEDGMQKIMALAGTFFGEGLKGEKRDPSEIYGKVGIAENFSDCAVIKRGVGGEDNPLCRCGAGRAGWGYA